MQHRSFERQVYLQLGFVIDMWISVANDVDAKRLLSFLAGFMNRVSEVYISGQNTFCDYGFVHVG